MLILKKFVSEFFFIDVENVDRLFEKMDFGFNGSFLSLNVFDEGFWFNVVKIDIDGL